MIRITKGTYGLLKNGAVEAITKHSAPFSLSAEREAELVALGVAEVVELSDDYSADMKMADLRRAAAAHGVDASAAKSKKEVIAMIEAAKAAKSEPLKTENAADLEE